MYKLVLKTVILITIFLLLTKDIGAVLPSSIIQLSQDVEELRLQTAPQASVAFWAESVKDGFVAENESENWPTASTIKYFILTAFYRQFMDQWNNQAPLGQYEKGTGESVSETLNGFTYRDLARGMMGYGYSEIGNWAYNQCANICIYFLGGPSECTVKIHSLNSGLDSVSIGRYMLEDRQPEDNLNPVEDFALLLRLLFKNQIPNLTESDHDNIRECLIQNYFQERYLSYIKTGSLSSIPPVRSEAGYYLKDDNALIWAVNVVDFTGDGAGIGTLENQISSLIKLRLLDAPGDSILTPTPVVCQPAGDIDCSGKVNSLDFGSLAVDWQTVGSVANLDGLGVVDAADAIILFANYNKEAD
ncbi:MAG TPA: serine hydrolase [Candidatus Bathyarchaeia archaeon]|nr:serine hydrolase [Candidatus Bathyarchaeia archaeon]